MKYLVKFNTRHTATIKIYFITNSKYELGKDLLNTEGTNKYMSIDTTAKTISLFNKVSEEKIKAVKINIAQVSLNMKYLHILHDFMCNEDHFICNVDAGTGKITISEIDMLKSIKHEYNMATWYSLDLGNLTQSEAIVIPCTHDMPKEGANYLGKECALGVMELNYSFCEPGQKHSRDMFADLVVYTSDMMKEFLFADPSVLIEHLKEHDLKDAITLEFTEAAFNKKIKGVVNDSNELIVVGIRAENGNVIWVPINVMLQYMDMTEEIFNSCLNTLKNKKIVGSYSVPSLDQFTDRTVKYLKIYLEKSIYFYTFANVAEMKAPCLNLTTGKYEDLEGYGFSF